MQVPVEYMYGRLISCFETSDEECCLVQVFEMVEVQGSQIRNDQNCPLLTALDFLMVIPASSIMSSVLMVHECTGDCSFSHTTRPVLVEREEVELDTGLTYAHDYSNNLYCLNIYYVQYNVALNRHQ